VASAEIDRGRGLTALLAPQPGQHMGERPIAIVPEQQAQGEHRLPAAAVQFEAAVRAAPECSRATTPTLSATIELRQRFPGIQDNAKAREQARASPLARHEDSAEGCFVDIEVKHGVDLPPGLARSFSRLIRSCEGVRGRPSAHVEPATLVAPRVRAKLGSTAAADERERYQWLDAGASGASLHQEV
jgi:hypothetical protein